MPWVEQVTLQSSAPSDVPGEAPVRTDRITTGARTDAAEAEADLAVGSDALQDRVTLTVQRTPGILTALQGTPMATPADAFTYAGETYSLRSYEQVYPHKVRITGER